jgi:hypothetical protein
MLLFFFFMYVMLFNNLEFIVPFIHILIVDIWLLWTPQIQLSKILYFTAQSETLHLMNWIVI